MYRRFSIFLCNPTVCVSELKAALKLRWPSRPDPGWGGCLSALQAAWDPRPVGYQPLTFLAEVHSSERTHAVQSQCLTRFSRSQRSSPETPQHTLLALILLHAFQSLLRLSLSVCAHRHSPSSLPLMTCFFLQLPFCWVTRRPLIFNYRQTENRVQTESCPQTHSDSSTQVFFYIHSRVTLFTTWKVSLHSTKKRVFIIKRKFQDICVLCA